MSDNPQPRRRPSRPARTATPASPPPDPHAYRARPIAARAVQFTLDDDQAYGNAEQIADTLDLAVTARSFRGEFLHAYIGEPPNEQNLEPGDWVVLDEHGARVLPAAVFAARYEAAA